MCGLDGTQKGERKGWKVSLTAHLSPSEEAWVEQAARSGDDMYRQEEEVNGAILYRAVSPRIKLFDTQTSDSFEALWGQAKMIYQRVNGVSAKEMAVKMYTVMRTDRAFGSRKIARLAGVEYGDGKTVKQILKKLRDAGKIKFEQGKWLKI